MAKQTRLSSRAIIRFIVLSMLLVCSYKCSYFFRKMSLLLSPKGSQDEVDGNGNGEVPLDGVANAGVVVVPLIPAIDIGLS